MKYISHNIDLLDESDDEHETVNWNDDCDNIIETFNCGCCNNCTCDDSNDCENCGCGCCNIDDNDINDGDNEEEIVDNDKISNLNINILEDNLNGKKVRITLELNVILSNKENEIVCIDLDINKNTYLKIAEELFK